MTGASGIWISALLPSAEPPRNVVLGLLLDRVDEDLLGVAVLDQLAQVEEGGVVRDSRGLLHVVGHDDLRVLGLEVLHQFLDAHRGDRVEG